MKLAALLKRWIHRPPLDRKRIAELYLRGDGIEIGALHQPLPVPETARVRYVDRMSVADLRKQYPELGHLPLVEPDVIDNGEELTQFAADSLDFIVANHFIEHCANPFRTIENLLRVLRPGGVIYLAIPDKRYTFDRDRIPTPVDHLLRDYREGPSWSRRAHFAEWVRVVNKIRDEEQAERDTIQLMEIDYSIHYHCWTQAGMFEFIALLKAELGFPFDVELFLKQGIECIFILRKSDESVGSALHA